MYNPLKWRPRPSAYSGTPQKAENEVMNDLPPKDLERLKPEAPPMTTLTLSAGFDDAGLEFAAAALFRRTDG